MESCLWIGGMFCTNSPFLEGNLRDTMLGYMSTPWLATQQQSLNAGEASIEKW